MSTQMTKNAIFFSVRINTFQLSNECTKRGNPGVGGSARSGRTASHPRPICCCLVFTPNGWMRAGIQPDSPPAIELSPSYVLMLAGQSFQVAPSRSAVVSARRPSSDFRRDNYLRRRHYIIRPYIRAIRDTSRYKRESSPDAR